MVIESVLCIEDSIEKYMDVFRFLRNQNVKRIEWATDAETAMNILSDSMNTEPFDLILSDMHFNYYGKEDQNAWFICPKCKNSIEQGYHIPIVFCSSQNWKIEGTLGSILYNPNRNWEMVAEQLILDIRKM